MVEEPPVARGRLGRGPQALVDARGRLQLAGRGLCTRVDAFHPRAVEGQELPEALGRSENSTTRRKSRLSQQPWISPWEWTRVGPHRRTIWRKTIWRDPRSASSEELVMYGGIVRTAERFNMIRADKTSRYLGLF